MVNYAYQTGTLGSDTNGLSPANIAEIRTLYNLYKNIQEFLFEMANGFCWRVDSEKVTLDVEAVARILELIMKRISRFAPSKYVDQRFTSRNQEIHEALAIISGVREKLGINSDLKEKLDNEMGYTQLFQDTNGADIQPLVAPDDVYAFFDVVMEFSFEIIEYIKECFGEDGILNDAAIEGGVQIALIVDKIKWHLLRIISVEQIPEYRNSMLCSYIINTLNEKSGNPQAVSIGQKYASHKLRQFEVRLSNRGVQVTSDRTQRRNLF